MQLLNFLALVIFIAFGAAVDNLDTNLFDEASLDPASFNSDLSGNGPNLFDDARESGSSLFHINNNNQWNPLIDSDAQLSSVDGIDWNSDSSLVANNDGVSDLLSAPSNDKGLFILLS